MKTQPLSDLASSFYRPSWRGVTDSETESLTESDESHSDSGCSISVNRTCQCTGRHSPVTADCRHLPVSMDDLRPLPLSPTQRLVVLPSTAAPCSYSTSMHKFMDMNHGAGLTSVRRHGDTHTVNVGVNTMSAVRQQTPQPTGHAVRRLFICHQIHRSYVAQCSSSKTLDLRSLGLGFNSHRGSCVATLGKLFTPM